MTIRIILIKVLKVVGWILLSLFILLLALILIIRTNWAQNRLISFATNWMSEKTGGNFSIGHFYLQLNGDIEIEDFYVGNPENDTILYSHHLVAGIEILPLFKGEISTSRIEWEGLYANVYRSETDSSFNFDFITNAFAGEDEEPTAKDTATSSPKITLGPIAFRNFRINYRDDLEGMYASVRLGNFELRTGDTDLENLRFHIKDFLLEDTFAELHISKASTPDTAEIASSGLMPGIRIDDFQFKNIGLNYSSASDSLTASLLLGHLALNLPETDLSRKNIHLKSLELRGLDLIVATTAEGTSSDTGTSVTEPFLWPDWNVKVDQVMFERNRIAYLSGNPEPENIRIDSLFLDLRDVYFRDREAGFELRQLAFRMPQGFQLETALKARLDNHTLSIDKFRAQTSNSSLSASAELQYLSIDSLIANPLLSKIIFELQPSTFSMKDAFYFQPALANDPQIKLLSGHDIYLQSHISGTKAELLINEFNAGWGAATKLSLIGKLGNLEHPDKISFTIPELKFSSSDAALQAFLPPNTLQLPKYMNLSANAQGSVEMASGELTFQSGSGDLYLNGAFSQAKEPEYRFQARTNELHLGQLLAQPDLGRLSSSLQGQGKGFDPKNLEADVSGVVSLLELKKYPYRDLSLEARADSGIAEVTLSYSDTNLVFNLDALADLSDSLPAVSADLRLDGANLQALGISESDIRTRMYLLADFRGDANNFDATASISKGLVIREGKPYPFDTVMVIAHADADSSSFSLSSDIMNARASGNANPTRIIDALTQHFSSYLNTTAKTPDSVMDSVRFAADVQVSQTDLLSEVLVPGLEHFSPATLKAKFDQREKQLALKVELDKLEYSGTRLDTLRAIIQSNGDTLGLHVGFARVTSGPADIHKTRIRASLSADSLNALVQISDTSGAPLFRLASIVTTPANETHIHIVPDSFILNRQFWSIPDNNRIIYAPDNLAFQDFSWNGDGQELTISGNSFEDIELAFRNFAIESLSSLVNPDTAPINGILEGNIRLRNLFTALSFSSDLNINSLEALGNPLGNLNVKAGNQEGNYELLAALGGAGINLDLKGKYNPSGSIPIVDADLKIRKVDIASIVPFTNGMITNPAGFLSGGFKISGPLDEPDYSGQIQFSNSAFRVPMLNTTFTFINEQIDVKDRKIEFTRLRIADNFAKLSTISGEIGLENMSDPRLNLNIKTDDFTLLNSGIEDNPMFYGKGVVDADIRIRGTVSTPDITAGARFEKSTSLTFIVPESQAEIVQREGVVVFVNIQNPGDPLTNQSASTESKAFGGIKLTAKIEVDPEAVFKVVIDERSGDFLEIAGLADLIFEMEPSGRMNLSGSYEVRSGQYKMSLYGLVKREFGLAPGSRITWSGDPLDASLDLTAVYHIKTASSDLMASQLTGADQATLTRYRQKLPFDVLVKIKGRLMRPEIAFAIDMPENQRGALGGNVYARVLQLNENEAELNQQVFSLLVLNRFVPTQQGSSEGNTTSQMARSSVSQVLSGQLNSLSEKYIKGVDVGVDLESFTDYQSGQAQDRTQVNLNVRKSFFNDRVSVQVGSQVDIEGPAAQQQQGASDIIGDVAVEYLLTDDGRYRLRGFRRNSFEGIVEGQLIVTGLSLVFNRDFNHFRELLKRPVNLDEEPENTTDSEEQ